MAPNWREIQFDPETLESLGREIALGIACDETLILERANLLERLGRLEKALDRIAFAISSEFSKR